MLPEALESHLAALEAVYDSAPEQELGICIFCYMQEDDCSCELSSLWPIELVLDRLRLKLGYEIIGTS